MKEEDTCEDSEFNSTGRGLVGIINVAFVGVCFFGPHLIGPSLLSNQKARSFMLKS